jgi:hypothetical protein
LKIRIEKIDRRYSDLGSQDFFGANTTVLHRNFCPSTYDRLIDEDGRLTRKWRTQRDSNSGTPDSFSGHAFLNKSDWDVVSMGFTALPNADETRKIDEVWGDGIDLVTP